MLRPDAADDILVLLKMMLQLSGLQPAAQARSCRAARKCTIVAQASNMNKFFDKSVNPLVASVKPSKTMALTDLATSMKEKGVDVRRFKRNMFFIDLLADTIIV